jgi:hypothetical protein
MVYSFNINRSVLKYCAQGIVLLILFLLLGYSRVGYAQSQVDVVEETSEVEKAHALFAAVKAADRFVNKLDSSYVLDLPVGIVANDKKDAEKYAIIISEMKLRNGMAFLTAYMAFTVPGTTKKIAFKGTDIPFSFSGGIQGVATLELVSDVDINLTQTMNLILKGGGNTVVKCDCFGFREMDIVADVLFDSTMFIPENPDGSLKSEALRTSFHTTISDWNNLMVDVSLEPFQLQGLRGVGFSITNAVLDLSDFRNPVNIQIPTQYQQDYIIDGSPNMWQGLYIQDAQIRLPRQFKKRADAETQSDVSPSESGDTIFVSDSVSTGRLTFYAQNLFIDGRGFTGTVGSSGLMTLDEGDLGGWAYSLDNFAIEIQSNHLVSAGFSGKISVPQFTENTVFNYDAVIGMNDSYSFNVGMADVIEMDMWAARMQIASNSMLSIAVTDSDFLPSLLLNGVLTVNAPVDEEDSTSTKLAIAKVPFQGMKIQTIKPYFSVDYISFGTSQNMFAQFPVSITEVGFEQNNKRFGLRIGAIVNFVNETDGGYGGNGVFTVWGKQENNTWKYDGVEVERIAVDISKPGAYELAGEVLFMRGDPIYGNGFKGTLAADFAGFGMDATALFGNVDGYRYWFADALVTMQTGIPAGPISVFGFGGGAYYHMKQAGIGNMPASDIGKTISGIYYAPDKQSGLGLKASVKFGLATGEKAFNGDVELDMSFNTYGGINQIAFNGNGYFATQDFSVDAAGIMEKAQYIVGTNGKDVDIPNDAEKSQLYGNVKMVYDFPNSCFHSTFDIYANIAGGIMRGTGSGGRAGGGVMHFEPSDWYIHLGTPDNPNSISVLNLATMSNYFMAGKSVPELPAPPYQVLNGLGIDSHEYTRRKNSSALADGSGFALGAYFSFDTGERSYLFFYGRFGCGLGFDILMKNYGELACDGRDGVGINGWYAQGQAYAWLAAAVGVNVDLPFYSGKYAIFEMEVPALMQAKAPNPFWMKGNVGGRYNILGGMIKGHCDFEFEIGEQCDMPSSNPLGGMSIIADMKPLNDENQVTVFTTPQVMFNMPVHEIIELRDENQVMHQYRIKLNHFTVETTDGTPVAGKLMWNERNDVLVFKSKNILPGKTTIQAAVSVRFEEYKNGNWYAVTKNGKVAEETKEIVFTTGEEPDYIPQENIAYSYPGYRAFNYYKSEADVNYVKLDFGQPKLFQPGAEWMQKARVAPASGGEVQYFDFTYDDAQCQINFSIPTDIQNNVIYRLDIVNVPLQETQKIDENVEQQADMVTVEAGEHSADVEITTQHATESRNELQEKLLYTMPFRTSRYNTFAEKLDGLTYSDGISWELYPLVHSLTVNISGERFDSYEVVNLNTETLITVSPLLSETPWYTTNIQPLFNLSSSQLSAIGAESFEPDELTNYLFQSDGTRRLTEDEIETGKTGETNGISGMKHYIAKYTCEYLYEIKGEISNAYVNRTIPAGQLETIFNANFTPLRYGNYPVNIKYTLPGMSNPHSVKKHIIKYRD